MRVEARVSISDIEARLTHIGSRKLTGPALPMSELGTIDAVLLSHDHHDDNHDAVGRTLLPSAGTVITTVAGAKRLGGHAQGLEPWQSTRLEAAGRPAIDITATPCRHGPPLSRPIVGHVVGFALRWETQTHGVLWISGDTVLYDGVRESRTGIRSNRATHLGGVRFPITGSAIYD